MSRILMARGRRQVLGWAAGGGAALLAAPGASFAQTGGAFPSRPVRILVSLPPGSGADTIARFLSKHLSQSLQQPFVVENRPGANSFLASQAVATAPADGYTMYVASNSPMTTNVVAFRQLPYDPVRDFAPVAGGAKFPMVFVVSASSSYRQLADLVGALRQSPGKFSYASGTATYRLAIEQFHLQNGVSAIHVPYKGTAPALVDVAAGTAEYSIADVSAVLPLIRSGKLRPLAVTSRERVKDLADVPTMIEAGNPNYEFYAWVAAFYPAKVEPAIVERVAAAIGQAMRSPEAAAFLGDIGGQAFLAGPKELGEFQRAEIAAMRSIATKVKMEPE